MDRSGVGPVPLLAASAARGLAVLAVAGCVLGAALGTPEFPLVGTALGGIQGAVVGGLVGLADGTVLAALVGPDPARTWPARAVSGAVSLLAVLGLIIGAGATLEVAPGVTAALVALATLAGGVAGPLIVQGPVVALRGPAAAALLWRRVGRLFRRTLVAGAVIGVATGLVIGAVVYLPTAAFAGIEGAFFGVVCGGVLGCLAVVAVTVPQLVRRG